MPHPASHTAHDCREWCQRAYASFHGALFFFLHFLLKNRNPGVYSSAGMETGLVYLPHPNAARRCWGGSRTAPTVYG